MKLSRKNILAILAGFLATVIFANIMQMIIVLMNIYILHTVPANQYMSALRNPQVVALRQFLTAISFLAPAFGGFVCGFIIKGRGWIYGGITGLVLRLTSIIFSLGFYFYIQSSGYPQKVVTRYQFDFTTDLLPFMFYSLLTVALASFGGWLGEKLRNYKKF